MSDESREAALLTNRQRRYLRGELTPSNERKMRGRIRKRISAGLEDGWLLHEHLSDDDVRLVFGDKHAEEYPDSKEIQEEEPDSAVSPAGPAGVVAFLARGLNYENEPLYPGLDDLGDAQPALAGFTEACELAVEHYLKTHLKYDANVTVNIDLDNLHPHADSFGENRG